MRFPARKKIDFADPEFIYFGRHFLGGPAGLIPGKRFFPDSLSISPIFPPVHFSPGENALI